MHQSSVKEYRGIQMKKREKVVTYKPSYIHDSAKIGKGTKIGAFVDIGKDVVIGADCNIQAHVTISNGAHIGDRVFIGPNTSILNDRYPVSKILTPPTIHDDVIIGGFVVILPNVSVGEKAVIGAGSVITKDVQKGSVVYGNPAEHKMSRQEYEYKKTEWERRMRK